MSSVRSLNPQRWLDAYTEPHAAIYTFSHCITLADLNGDGDFKLVMADLGTGSANIKLKVYKGTSLMTESTLIDVPTGVVAFHMDTSDPRIPAVAVASGYNIYVYKNMRPYFKFSLPSLDVNSLEREVWLQVREKSMEVETFYELVQNLRQEIGFSHLTSRSQQFLMSEPSKWKDFVETYKNIPLKKQTVITCITTLKKNMAEEDAVACLVVGTENGSIFILDPEAFTILESMNLTGPSVSSNTVPVHLAATGLYDVEFRVIAACRDGNICLVRRGWKEARIIIQLSSQVVAMIVMPDNSNIITALMEKSIHCYTKKGKKQWEIKTPKSVSAMTLMPLHHQSISLVVVALAGGTVHFYHGRQLVDVITVPDTVSAVRFGHFGQEEHSLILVTVGGCLMVKILKRTAHFTPQSDSSGLMQTQHIKMQVPKKTKLFLEQTRRERENAIAMHQTFQHDLFRLRLTTARAYVNVLQSCTNPISSSVKDPLKLTAQVLGLGPKFKMLLTLENMSAASPSKDLAILLHCDDKLYSVEKPYIKVPMLVPKLIYQFETTVECISDMGISDQVRVFIIKINQMEPLLAVLITMPVCDMLAVV
ncbi:Bardet-Biedl syndrome 1 protein homolog [Anabrus simplex]|uniref:Bardet-Biedl syndrome 1 protein homolog n=1 Tax=Anabrus simplex TaxID=316456 RepID=UPI0034DD65D9